MPTSTQETQAGCSSRFLEKVQKSQECPRIHPFEFNVCLLCSDTVRDKKFLEFLARMHAVSTTLYRCMGCFTVSGTVRAGGKLRYSMSKNNRVNASDEIIKYIYSKT